MFVKTATAATLLALTANASLQYKVFATKLTWKNAGAACKKWGGALASIKSAGEQKLAFAAVKAYGTSKGQLWLGAADTQSEGAWRWADGSNVEFQNWAKHEPNDAGGLEDCATFGGSSGNWNDDSCAKTHAYTCEKGRAAANKNASFADDSYLGSMGAWGEAQRKMREWNATKLRLVVARAKKIGVYFSEKQKALAARLLAARWERDWLTAVKAHEAAIAAHKFSWTAMQAAVKKAQAAAHHRKLSVAALLKANTDRTAALSAWNAAKKAWRTAAQKMYNARKAFNAAHVARNLKKDIFDTKLAAWKAAKKAKKAAEKDAAAKNKTEQAAGRARSDTNGKRVKANKANADAKARYSDAKKQAIAATKAIKAHIKNYGKFAL